MAKTEARIQIDRPVGDVYAAEFELSGPLRLIDPLVGRMVHRQFEANLAALKHRLEARGSIEG